MKILCIVLPCFPGRGGEREDGVDQFTEILARVAQFLQHVEEGCVSVSAVTRARPQLPLQAQQGPS